MCFEKTKENQGKGQKIENVLRKGSAGCSQFRSQSYEQLKNKCGEKILID